MTEITCSRWLVISSSHLLRTNNISCGQDPSHLQTHAAQSHGHACLDNDHKHTQPTPVVPSQQRLVNKTADSSFDHSSSKRHASPSKNMPRASSPPRRKRPVVLGWPPVARHDRELHTSTALAPSVASESHAAESSTHHNSHSQFHIPTEPSPTAGASAAEPNRSAKLHAVKKSNTDGKQTLACLFCRERKIACGRPAGGSADSPCK